MIDEEGTFNDARKLDRDRIARRFDDIAATVSGIRKHLQEKSDEEIRADDDLLAALKFYVIQNLEAMGNVCVHLASHAFSTPVDTYGACFDVLARHGLFSGEQREKIEEARRFRNQLVHQYWKIGDDELLEFCREHLDAFEMFIKAVNEYIEQTESQNGEGSNSTETS